MAKNEFTQNDLLDLGEGSKKCSRCGEMKSQDEFYRIRTGRQAGQFVAACRSCVCETAKLWKKKNKDKHRANLRRQRYGLLSHEYEEMFKQQAGLCAICRSPETCKSNSGIKRVLCIDHDHETGAVRSLLCSSCNIGVARFRDDPFLLRVAADYIERHRRSQTELDG